MKMITTYLHDDYIKLLAIYAILLLFSLLFNKIIYRLLMKYFDKTPSNLDEEVLIAVKPPMNLLFFIGAIYATNEILKYQLRLDVPLKAMFAFFIFWLMYRMVEPFKDFFLKITEKFGEELSEDLAVFFIKSIKVFIFLIGGVAVLQTFGYDVTGFVASLGLGGLAFALAAKDTAANLFGSLVIFGDRPFKVGDWVVINSVEGNVEEIGIRSTKIRTFDNTIVSVPNASVANSEITNWTKMDKRRVKLTIDLSYNTPPQTLQTINQQIIAFLHNSKEIYQDTLFVNFTDFNDSSLGITIIYHTIVTTTFEYLNIKEMVNYKIMEIVAQNHATFAYPTRTIYIEKE
jgi:MscS family membrane protein